MKIVRIWDFWFFFPRIQEILYSVQIPENTDLKKFRIRPGFMEWYRYTSRKKYLSCNWFYYYLSCGYETSKEVDTNWIAS